MRVALLLLVCVSLAACGVKGPLKHEGKEENPEKIKREWQAKPSTYGH